MASFVYITTINMNFQRIDVLETISSKNTSKMIGKDLNYCWQDLYFKKVTTTPLTILCAFQPTTKPYTRKQKTVILGIGVHLGPAADESHSCNSVGLEHISWEQRSEYATKKFNPYLSHSYNKNHLLKTQKLFWEQLRTNTQLLKADIIVCGFDVWHCLLLAPFNKKMILNSAYRFEGHRPTTNKDAINLQKILYNAVRYNPDVILGGIPVYDIVYQQHFLGSHKIIPLPATCEYVHERLHKELTSGDCQGTLWSSTGYHPIKMEVIIMPRRLSAGRGRIADEIIRHAEKVKRKYKITRMEGKFKGGYNYCELGMFQAGIILGYSVMSYFTCEVASLGIPLFVPTPQLYAEWERKYHLISERKNNLTQGILDAMKENPRSIKAGYNPNNDYNMEDIFEWVKYSDYYYYEGVVQFDSYEDLFVKLENADFRSMNEKMLQHRKKNNLKNNLNWKAAERYFFEGEQNVGPSYQPKTFEEGMELWRMKTSPFNFSKKMELKRNHRGFSKVVLVNYNEYVEVFGTKPICKHPINGYKILFYSFNTQFLDSNDGCHFVDLKKLPESSNIKNLMRQFPEWKSNRYIQYLIMLMHVVGEGATTVGRLYYQSSTPCPVRLFTTLLINVEGWSETEFLLDEYWYAWTPFTDSKITMLWFQLVSKFIQYKPRTNRCLVHGNSKGAFYDDISSIQDYFQHWKTDETQNFFSLLDQLNFEMAVRGYVTKYFAILHRMWLETVSRYTNAHLPSMLS